MKMLVKKDASRLRSSILAHYSDYNVIYDAKVNEDTYFIVIEKFFLRTSRRASLSIVLSAEDEYSTIILGVSSGGGVGMIIKFDWGTKSSFENQIINLLKVNNIAYEVL